MRAHYNKDAPTLRRMVCNSLPLGTQVIKNYFCLPHTPHSVGGGVATYQRTHTIFLQKGLAQAPLPALLVVKGTRVGIRYPQLERAFPELVAA